MVPHGLEWDMGGDSLVAYVPLLKVATADASMVRLQEFYRDHASTLVDTPDIRRAIVEAHNKWCFAKEYRERY